MNRIALSLALLFFNATHSLACFARLAKSDVAKLKDSELRTKLQTTASTGTFDQCSTAIAKARGLVTKYPGKWTQPLIEYSVKNLRQNSQSERTVRRALATMAKGADKTEVLELARVIANAARGRESGSRVKLELEALEQNILRVNIDGKALSGIKEGLARLSAIVGADTLSAAGNRMTEILGRVGNQSRFQSVVQELLNGTTGAQTGIRPMLTEISRNAPREVLVEMGKGLAK